MCKFLEDHYVEDTNGNFKVTYSPEKLRWACGTPGYIKDIHLLVRNSKNKKIMASAITDPKNFIING